ncbi:bacteriochlorophyll 4-vinyl reductase [Roseibaca sp. Y0-43]|uniref:bacteriochlorophyll 4-vinyl reductase n=1 Tax=Roseibaca sp. Y0-43 TaxID=2816854 RepID=UPI001D0C4E21|nr:bacteriochlorophyll 4-vinyl reductase [Roseibaca sp. Y0-43]MCC1482170.1 bacteriochlorophyll 4-vinyl reductase [Roseibaca sp. Y0-43]
MTALTNDGARIGPNAILQHVPVLDATIGERLRGALLYRAGVAEPPADAGMWPEAEVARLHHAVRLFLPDRAPAIQRAAGLAVGDYILAHRIPKLAQRLIRALPAQLGARLLTMAIAKHSWTFAGSGQFRVLGYGPLRVEIRDNPLAQHAADAPICHWHAAVFERLYSALVWPDVRVVEEACAATGAPACLFRIAPRA